MIHDGGEVPAHVSDRDAEGEDRYAKRAMRRIVATGSQWQCFDSNLCCLLFGAEFFTDTFALRIALSAFSFLPEILFMSSTPRKGARLIPLMAEEPTGNPVKLERVP